MNFETLKKGHELDGLITEHKHAIDTLEKIINKNNKARLVIRFEEDTFTTDLALPLDLRGRLDEILLTELRRNLKSLNDQFEAL